MLRRRWSGEEWRVCWRLVRTAPSVHTANIHFRHVHGVNDLLLLRHVLHALVRRVRMPDQLCLRRVANRRGLKKEGAAGGCDLRLRRLPPARSTAYSSPLIVAAAAAPPQAGALPWPLARAPPRRHASWPASRPLPLLARQRLLLPRHATLGGLLGGGDGREVRGGEQRRALGGELLEDVALPARDEGVEPLAREEGLWSSAFLRLTLDRAAAFLFFFFFFPPSSAPELLLALSSKSLALTWVMTAWKRRLASIFCSEVGNSPGGRS